MTTENTSAETAETEEPTTKSRHQTSVPVDGDADTAQQTADGPADSRHQTSQPAD
jgi:hypothetical protein